MTTASSGSRDSVASTMRSKAARTTGLIIGGLAVLVGGVWIGQGAGLHQGKLHDGEPHVAGHRTALPCRRSVPDLLDPAAALGRRRPAQRSLVVCPRFEVGLRCSSPEPTSVPYVLYAPLMAGGQ